MTPLSKPIASRLQVVVKSFSSHNQVLTRCGASLLSNWHQAANSDSYRLDQAMIELGSNKGGSNHCAKYYCEFDQCIKESPFIKLVTCDHHPSCHLWTVLCDSERQSAIIFLSFTREAEKNIMIMKLYFGNALSSVFSEHRFVVCVLWLTEERRESGVKCIMLFFALFSAALSTWDVLVKCKEFNRCPLQMHMFWCTNTLHRQREIQSSNKQQDWKKMGVLKKLCLPNATLFFLGQVKQLMFWAATSLFQLFSRILCMAITQMYDKNFKDHGGNWI